MGLLYIPSFSEMLAVSHSHGADSDAPGLWDGLVGLWPLASGGGGTAFDLSGYGRDGTWNGTGTHWTGSERGTVGQLNGSDDYIGASLLGSFNDVSISVWVKLSSDTEAFIRFAGWDAGPKLWRSSGSLATFYSLGFVYTGTIVVGTSVTLQAADGWTHIIGTKSGSSWTLYANGSPIGTGTQALSWSNKAFEIGRRAWAAPDEYVPGFLSDTRVYNRALAPSEAQQLYLDPFASLRLRRRVFAVAGGNRRRRLLTACGA